MSIRYYTDKRHIAILDEPPAPPPPRPLKLFAQREQHSNGRTTSHDDTGDEARLWLALQQESYRQRGTGLHPEHPFTRAAIEHRLGAPLAPAAPITLQGTPYAFQPFARDTLFSELAAWGTVQRLSVQLEGTIPERGTARELLAASYRATGQQLHPEWAFHQVAVRLQLGVPLGASHRIGVQGDTYSVQVFACDTLYCRVPDWNTVQRMSETAAGRLAAALWEATCHATATTCLPETPQQRLAIREHLGAPLGDSYQVDVEGSLFAVQVFATETLFAAEGQPPRRQTELAMPASIAAPAAPQPGKPLPAGHPRDALSSKRPTFALLPIAGQPRISQFYGATRWAAGAGRSYYRACQGRHPGIDFAVPTGTPLLAMGYGLVVWAGSSGPFAAGPRSIIVRYGGLYALYGHVSRECVTPGQMVRPGQLVGYSGSLGAPHLHFEVRVVPPAMLQNRAPDQAAVNPGYATNPLRFFATALQPYIDRWLTALDAEEGGHFCHGSLYNQEDIWFGGPVDRRPCSGEETDEG